MRDVFGLLVALAALVVIWLWATGRFDAAWAGITGGTSAPPVKLPADPGQSGGGAGGSWAAVQSILNQTSYVQATPPYVSIPSYVSLTPSAASTA